MSILAAYMVPHPPMIVPKIGKGSEKQITKTIHAYEEVADEIAALKPETIIISSPHSILYADYFHISPGTDATGNFGRFGAPQVRFSETYDTELTEKICSIAKENDFPAGMLGELLPPRHDAYQNNSCSDHSLSEPRSLHNRHQNKPH